MCYFMQLWNCINKGMLLFLECLSYFVVDDLILLFVTFVELLGLVYAFFYCLWDYFSCLCLAVRHCSGYESAIDPWRGWFWAHKCWTLVRACVKVADYCGPSSAGTLTCIKMIEMYIERFCHCMCVIRNSGLLSFVLLRTFRSSSIASSHLIK
jgi:hypothetical protein